MPWLKSFGRVVRRVLRDHGLGSEIADLAAAEPKAWTLVADLMPFRRYGQEESRAFWDAFYRALLSELGQADDERLRAALYREFQRLENWRLYPDAVPTLVKLRERGFKLGVVSNWEEWLEELLLALEVHQLFDVIVASGPFGRGIRPGPARRSGSSRPPATGTSGRAPRGVPPRLPWPPAPPRPRPPAAPPASWDSGPARAIRRSRYSGRRPTPAARRPPQLHVGEGGIRGPAPAAAPPARAPPAPRAGPARAAESPAQAR